MRGTLLRVHLRVKFRAFGITFGTVDKVWEEFLPVEMPGVPRVLVSFDERGVFLLVTQTAEVLDDGEDGD